MTPDQAAADDGDIDRVDDELNGTTEAVETAARRPGRRYRILLVRSWIHPLRSLLLLILAAVLVVAAAALTGWIYFYHYQPDQQTQAADEKGAIKAASDGTIALLSYTPESIDTDLANARSHLTGDFLAYYSKFTEQIVAPAAKQRGVKTTAVVAQAAVSELRPDSAVVLLFVNQQTTSKNMPEPSLTASSVLVRLMKVHGNRLISKFDPM